MDNNQNPADKVVADIKNDFVAVGKHHVHGWYAWAIVGIVAGMLGGLLYVANWQGKFTPSNAGSPVQFAVKFCPWNPPDLAISGKGEGTANLTNFEVDAWSIHSLREDLLNEEYRRLTDEQKIAYKSAAAKMKAANDEASLECQEDLKMQYAKKSEPCDQSKCALNIAPAVNALNACVRQPERQNLTSYDGHLPANGVQYIISYKSDEQKIAISCTLNPVLPPLPVGASEQPEQKDVPSKKIIQDIPTSNN